MRILIIIPAFNEAENIRSVIRSLAERLHAHESQHRYSFLVINDGSRDDTAEVVQAEGVRCITLPYNMGIGNAVHTGYLVAQREGFDVAIQFDGDGQHPAQSIPDLVSVLAGGQADFVIGSRFLGSAGFKSTLGRRLGIKFLSALICSLSRQRITDPTSGLRAVNRSGIQLFANSYPHDYPEPEAIVIALRNGLRLTELPVTMHERQGGVSSIRFFGSLYYMCKVSLAVWLRSLETRRSKALP